MSKTVFEHVVTDEDGVIKERRFVKKEVKSVDEFLLLYIKHIGTVAKLPHYELQTLLCLCPHINWDNGIVSISPYVQDQVLECSGLKYSSIRSALSRLAKRNFLHKVKNNWYEVNPEIFWKGSELKRDHFQAVYQWDIVKAPAKNKKELVPENTEFLTQKSEQ